MKAIDRLCRPENISLAWLRIQTNPEPAYKKYFRRLYTNYSVAEAKLLNELAARLKKGVYTPAHGCKILFPKASGGLRPYTLLTVEDQVIYQSFANVIAELLRPKVQGRYFYEVFS